VNSVNKTLVACPGCGLELPSDDNGLDGRYHASRACVQLFWELCALPLSTGDPDFIHQLAVDAYAAQHSGANMKPITTAFALMGLFLTFERGFTGKEVQRAHMVLGKRRVSWPRFNPPARKAALTVSNVLQNLDRENYRGKIQQWAGAVWDTWENEHDRIKRLLDAYYRPGK
jgi:hypothetical protein